MKILHLLSQLELTGAESYAVTLIKRQLQDNHDVFIVSDYLHLETNAHYISIPLHKRNFTQRLKNIASVYRLVKEKQIDLIHGHSRAAIWIGNVVAKLIGIPLVSTIHGRQSPRLSKKLFSCYGDQVIAVCENIRQQISSLKIAHHKIIVIPNPFDFKVVCPDISVPITNTEKQLKIVLAGRTSGPKGQRMVEFLASAASILLAESDCIMIQLVGGYENNLPIAGQNQLKVLQQQYPGRIECLGFVSNLKPILEDAICVIAAGRIAIETLILQKPVLALGEGCYSGIVSAKNWERVVASNFGDIDLAQKYAQINYDQVLSDIRSILFHKKQGEKKLNRKLKAYYDVEHVYEEIMNVYHKARIQKHYSADFNQECDSL